LAGLFFFHYMIFCSSCLPVTVIQGTSLWGIDIGKLNSYSQLRIRSTSSPNSLPSLDMVNEG
ncbi:hypothetical protein, partial [uncultured Bacteroides sp.]|uniref:hypothetical protein n=1 Tax=uncultured Bacteroides sp. TaxID=162156 RepID=UPI00259A858D